MKGKLYKPFSMNEVILNETVQKPKPWAKDSDEPIVYMWSSSIPEKWLKIKGKQAFQHISKTDKNKNTLEFLTTNQKYINSIADPRSQLISNQTSAVTSRIQSPRSTKKTSINLNNNINQVLLQYNSERFLSLPESPLPEVNITKKLEKDTNVFQYEIPENNKKLVKTGSLSTFVIGIPEKKPEQYIVNKYSRPNALIKAQKKQEDEIEFKNRTVSNYIKRFGKKSDTFSTLLPRRGVNGWKLVNIKRLKKSKK